MSGTEYISSAGLRILLILRREIHARNRKMWLTGVPKSIMEVFQITGFADILEIRE